MDLYLEREIKAYRRMSATRLKLSLWFNKTGNVVTLFAWLLPVGLWLGALWLWGFQIHQWLQIGEMPSFDWNTVFGPVTFNDSRGLAQIFRWLGEFHVGVYMWIIALLFWIAIDNAREDIRFLLDAIKCELCRREKKALG